MGARRTANSTIARHHIASGLRARRHLLRYQLKFVSWKRIALSASGARKRAMQNIAKRMANSTIARRRIASGLQQHQGDRDAFVAPRRSDWLLPTSVYLSLCQPH